MTALHPLDAAALRKPRSVARPLPAPALKTPAWWRALPRRLERVSTRTGVRLVAVQTAMVICAFGLAGYASQVSITWIHNDEVRREVLGEEASLQIEFVEKGAAHLPHTVAKRQRLWRGFEYRWTEASGRETFGGLPMGPAAQGWARVRASATSSREGAQTFLVHTRRLPDGSWLSVGQNLAVAQRETAAVMRALLGAGALGVAFCLAASYAFSRGVWRRLTGLAHAAQQVSTGRLDVRAPQSTPGLARGFGDDVDEVAHAFNTMLERLELQVAQIRQVSSDIAHDLRTPLTRVRQRLERLQRDDLAGPAGAELARVDQDLDEILRVFDALLRLAEIENTDDGAPQAQIDLAEIAQRLAETYRPDIEAAGRAFHVRVEAATVTADAQLVSQAIANLLDNALRHTPAGASIALAVQAGPKSATLTVTDQGQGVSVADRARVVQRFRRLDPSRSGPGSGLGLAIVAAIARRHRAELTLGDAGPGLRVDIAFPAEGLKKAHAPRTP